VRLGPGVVSLVVPRTSVNVRPASVEDMGGLLALHAEMRETLGRRVPRSVENGRSAEEHFMLALADPDVRLLVAVDEADQVIGMAHLHAMPPAVLLDSRMVHAALLHVRRSARSRGAGRALIAAAAVFAEEVGADQLSVDVYPQHRESQRFYVRLGFAPLVVRRVAPLALLRRRLGPSYLVPPVPTVGEATDTATRRGVRARLETARAVSVARRRVG
jgi:GNAT superfamily N-acetyltransferase